MMMMVVKMRTKVQIVMMRMMVMIVMMMMMMVMRSRKTLKDSACFHGLAVPSLALKDCGSCSGSSSAVQE